jgi:hypothetical protein
MAPNIRRRRWPLFFEPRRRFKKKVLKIVIQINRILRYAARAAARIAKGRGIRAVLEYAAAAAALVKKAGKGVRLDYFMGPLRTAVKKAGRAVLLMYSALERVGTVRRFAAVPRLFFRPWDPTLRLYRRKAPLPRADYQAHDPNVWTKKRPRGTPRIYWSSDLSVRVQRVRPVVHPVFCNVNDSGPRRTIVCVDKMRGDPGCSDNEGDLVGGVLLPPGLCSDPRAIFEFRRFITAFVTSEDEKYWSITFYGPDGRAVKICPQVTKYSPCVLTVEEFTAAYGPA